MSAEIDVNHMWNQIICSLGLFAAVVTVLDNPLTNDNMNELFFFNLNLFPLSFVSVLSVCLLLEKRRREKCFQ